MKTYLAFVNIYDIIYSTRMYKVESCGIYVEHIDFGWVGTIFW